MARSSRQGSAKSPLNQELDFGSATPLPPLMPGRKAVPPEDEKSVGVVDDHIVLAAAAGMVGAQLALQALEEAAAVEAPATVTAGSADAGLGAGTAGATATGEAGIGAGAVGAAGVGTAAGTSAAGAAGLGSAWLWGAAGVIGVGLAGGGGGGGGTTNRRPLTGGGAVFAGTEDAVMGGQVPVATDPDNDPLNYQLVGAAPAGVTFNADGTFLVAPQPADQELDVGEARLVTFQYVANDGKTDSYRADITVTIHGDNDAPVVGGDVAIAGGEDDVAITGVVPVARDADNEGITYALVGSVPAGVTFNADGTFSVTPQLADQGLDDGGLRELVFQYVANDGTVDSLPATVRVTIHGANDAPLSGGSATVSGNEDDAFIAGAVPAATDLDGESLAYALLDAVPPGVTFNADGTFSVTPLWVHQGLGDGETSVVTFQYVATDGTASSEPMTVTVTVAGANDVPVSGGDMAIAGTENELINGNLPAATDVDDLNLVYFAVGSLPAGVTLNTNGTFSVLPQPADRLLDDGESRAVTFQYVASDGKAASAVATVTVTIMGVTDVQTSITGTDGDDYLEGTAGDDSIDARAGNDTVYAHAGDDVLLGGPGFNQLLGDDGSDTLINGDDGGILEGGHGNDILTGGAGVDFLVGGDGDDIYRFGVGGARDSLDNEATDSETSTDAVEFGGGLTLADIGFARSGDNLSVSIIGTVDGIDIGNQFRVVEQWVTEGHDDGLGNWTDTSHYVQVRPAQVDEFRFADGTVLTADEVLLLVNMPTVGDDYLVGTAADDLIDALAGDDTVFGFAGNDTLVGGAGTNQLYGGDGDDTLINGDEGGTLNGEYGNDTLTGGAGNDTLSGGAGNDVYVFGIGGGWDSLVNWAGDSGTTTDAVRFGAGLAVEDVRFSRAGDNLSVSLAGGSEGFDVAGHFYSYEELEIGGAVLEVHPYRVDEFRFADGTVLTAVDILAMVNAPTEGNDYLEGTDGDDDISALGGDDIVLGLAGNDTLLGGAGWNRLSGGFGDDTLVNGNDGGYLYGDAGHDTLRGGAGTDYLSGGDGSDVYLFGVGGGRDTLDNWSQDYALATDAIEFASGLTLDDVDFTRSWGSLSVSLVGSSDGVDISNHFSSLYVAQGALGDPGLFAGGGTDIRPGTIDEFRFSDGTVLTATDVFALVNVATVGSDMLEGTAGDDTIDALAGDDVVWAFAGNDTLAGGQGSEFLYGQAGDDRLTGGAGNDVLAGGEGNDVYVFGMGGGWDTLDNLSPVDSEATIDVVEFAAGLTAADVHFTRSGDGMNLSVTLVATGEGFDVANHFRSQVVPVSDGGSIDARPGQVDAFRFADGTILTAADVLVLVNTVSTGNDYLEGTDTDSYIDVQAGDDVVHARGGDDTLVGGTGSDLLSGGSGSDVYVFRVGDGRDTLQNWSADSALTTDAVEFGVGLTVADIQFTRAGDGLSVTVNGAGEGFDVGGHFYAFQQWLVEGHDDGAGNWIDTSHFVESRPYQIDEFRFADGLVLTAAEVLLLANTPSASGNSLTGTDGDDVIDAQGGDDIVYAHAGNDVLIGGAGNDYLSGGEGGDTYVVGTGGGWDTVDNWSADSETTIDAIAFGVGLTVADIRFDRVGDGLTVSLVATGEGFDLGYQFYVHEQWVTEGHADEFGNWIDTSHYAQTRPGQIDEFRFADGTVLTAADILPLLVSAGSVLGSAGDDLLSGSVGNERLVGLGGNDTLTGGGGRDHLAGGAGDDTYVFGVGDGEDEIDQDVDAGIPNVPGYDVIRLQGVIRAHAELERVGLDLTVRLLDEYGAYTGDSIRVQNQYYDETAFGLGYGSFAVSALQFDDLTLTGPVPDVVMGDIVIGTDGNDLLAATTGVGDIIVGRGGNDLLGGGVGADVLVGATGNDILAGGAGDDELYGGMGADTYVHEYGVGGADIIQDYVNELLDDPADADVLAIHNAPAAVGDLVIDFLMADQDGPDADLVIHIGDDPAQSIEIGDFFAHDGVGGFLVGPADIEEIVIYADGGLTEVARYTSQEIIGLFNP